MHDKYSKWVTSPNGQQDDITKNGYWGIDRGNAAIDISEDVNVYPTGVRYGGHILSIGSSRVTCVMCSEQEQIDDLIESTGGFLHAIYKLYKVAQFQGHPCNREKSYENLQTKTKPAIPNNSPDNIPSDRIHWSDGKFTTNNTISTNSSNETVIRTKDGRRVLISGNNAIDLDTGEELDINELTK